MKKIKWKTLGEICEIKTGQQINKRKIFENKGIYPVINSGKQPLGYINTWNTEDDPIGITTRGAGVGSITYQIGKYFRGNLNYSVTIKNNRQLNTRFLYHLLLEFQKSIYKLCTFDGIPALNSSEIKKLEIPLPPLKKQEEIAAVLDKFTELTEELTEELTAREAQYDYYRNMLLSQEWIEREEGKEVEWKALEEVIEYEQPTKYIVSSKKYGSDFLTPVLTAGQSFVLGYTDEKKGIYNASTEKPVIIFDDFTTSNHWIDFDFKIKSSALKILKAKDSVISLKYCYYYMQTILFDISEHRRKWISQYSKIKIPFPSLKAQKKIVDILDKFDALTNDIRQGLPKEIELRRKQYEYYREKLLTFEEK